MRGESKTLGPLRARDAAATAQGLVGEEVSQPVTLTQGHGVSAIMEARGQGQLWGI